MKSRGSCERLAVFALTELKRDISVSRKGLPVTNRKRVIVALAALLGALAGTSLVRSHADACSCAANNTWDLNLEHSTEPDDSIWPEGAVLQTTSSGDIEVRAYEWLEAKIEYVRGVL